MSATPAGELCSGYEALRAVATGSVVAAAPRGLALLLGQGLPAWIRAWAPLPPPAAPRVALGERPVVAGLAGEVVRVLTEMALGCRSELAAS